MRRIALYLIILLLAGCNFKDDGYRTVVKVIDGDTFTLENGEKVRLIGIDAPESRNTGRKKIGYYGREAKEHLKTYLTGKRVRLELDVAPKDRYQRTLAYVYLEDGTFMNAELLRQGYAMVYTVPPNVRHADEFVDLQREARENNRGLWAGHQYDDYQDPGKKPKKKKRKKKKEPEEDLAF